jgi:FkbM family methyltransferase
MRHIARSFLRKIERLCHFSSVRGHTFWTVPLNKNSVIIDLGANRGDFSFELKKTYGCPVYSVEPNSNLAPVSPDLSIDHLAITGQSGTVKFILSDNPEASSLYHEIANSFGISHEIEVRALTLPEYLKEKGITSEVSILKLDIEGGEIEVLKTLERKDLSRIDQITVEFHVFLNPLIKESTLAAISTLSNLGFTTVNCNYPYYDDFLFINKEIIKEYKLRYLELVFMRLIYWSRGIFHQVIGTPKAFGKTP